MVHANWAVSVLSYALCAAPWAYAAPVDAAPAPARPNDGFHLWPDAYLDEPIDKDGSLGLGKRARVPVHILPPPELVYRGDKRSPEQLRAAGGFLPSTEVPPSDENNGFSLYVHHLGQPSVDGKRVTAYVSTTRLFGTGLGYANMANGDVADGGYLYQIHNAPHMIDSDGTLLDNRRYSNEYEFSALGGVRWDQVKAWVKTPGRLESRDFGDFSSWGLIDQDIFEKKFPELKLIPNQDYDTKYDQLNGTAGQPQLAGWDESTGTEAFNKDAPWDGFQDKTVREYALEFMQEHGGPVGFDGSLPLKLTASAAKPQAADKETGGALSVTAFCGRFGNEEKTKACNFAARRCTGQVRPDASPDTFFDCVDNAQVCAEFTFGQVDECLGHAAQCKKDLGLTGRLAELDELAQCAKDRTK